MIVEGKCKWCDKPFTADSRRAKTKRFCSSKCRYAAWEIDEANSLAVEIVALVAKYRKRGALRVKEEKRT